MAGGIITSSDFAKLMWPGVNSTFGQSYDAWPTEWTDLVETRTSDKAYEEILSVTGLGLAQVKGEGAPIQYDSMNQGYLTRFRNVVFASGYQITREAYEDNQYSEVILRNSPALADSMNITKEIVVANLYNRAFTSGYVGGDGVTLINSAHPSFSGGASQSNLVSGDLSEATLESAIKQMAQWTDDRGLKRVFKPKVLLVHPDNMFEAERILKSVYRTGSANNGSNEINALYSMGAIPEGYKVNHYFTDSNAWFLRNGVRNGMLLFQRRKLEFGMDNDTDTENAKYKASERYSTGWGDWRDIIGSSGA